MAHTNHYLKLQPSEKSALEASLAWAVATKSVRAQ
jgi:hypothetical protein